MKIEKIIETIKIAATEVEWNYPLDYTIALNEAAELLENPVPEAPTAVIMNYKSKACEMVGNNCNKCEGAYKYNNKTICVFDTVNRFIEWNNEYNK